MGKRQNHHYHHHHKRYPLSNCCIGLNVCIFIAFLIAGAIVAGVSLVPSLQYQEGWVRINCTMAAPSSLYQVCQKEKPCQQITNQVKFPYYFPNHVFPFEYYSDEGPTQNSNAPLPPNTCKQPKNVQCFNSTVTFNYPINTTYVNSQTLYMFGPFEEASNFNFYFQNLTNDQFRCWMSTSNSSLVSVIPIPRYAPAAAVTSGVLLALSLISLIILLVLISIRCFCNTSLFKSDYTIIPYQHLINQDEVDINNNYPNNDNKI